MIKKGDITAPYDEACEVADRRLLPKDYRRVSNHLLARLLKYHGDNPPDAEARAAVAVITEALQAPAKASRQAVRDLLDKDEAAYEAFASQSDMHRIVAEVAHKHDLKREDIFKRRRRKKLVHARQEAMARCAEETNHSLPKIGAFFGFDHTTVLYAASVHAARIKGERFDRRTGRSLSRAAA